MQLTARPRARSALRCAFCHDELATSAYVCAGCSTTLHLECEAALARCPTLGCSRRRITLRARSRTLWETARPFLPWMLPSFLLAAALLALLWYVHLPDTIAPYIYSIL